MAEYIEKEAAIAWFAGYEANDPHEYISPRHIMEDLSEIPAADVVEVVHCRACKYWQDNNGGYPHDECRWGNGETPDADDFCSYGERKTTD